MATTTDDATVDQSNNTIKEQMPVRDSEHTLERSHQELPLKYDEFSLQRTHELAPSKFQKELKATKHTTVWDSIVETVRDWMNSESASEIVPAFNRVNDKTKEAFDSMIHSAPAQYTGQALSGLKDTMKHMVEPTSAEKPIMARTSSNGSMTTTQAESLVAFAFTGIPLLFTLWRAYFANDGPSWFSFHPIMMMTSMITLLGSVLAQRLSGNGEVSRVGLLTFASSATVLTGAFVIWFLKEMYGKTHLKTMHGHMGGVTVFAVLAYGFASMYVYSSKDSQSERTIQAKRYLSLTAKSIVSVAIFSMMAGIAELERNYIMMMIWMASILLFVPFLII